MDPNSPGDYWPEPSTSAASSTTSSSECFDQARAWLRGCYETHSCRTPGPEKASRYFPTRIIDVKPVDGADWRLCVSALDSTPNARYMTLSHRWEKGPLLTLSKA